LVFRRLGCVMGSFGHILGKKMPGNCLMSSSALFTQLRHAPLVPCCLMVQLLCHVPTTHTSRFQCHQTMRSLCHPGLLKALSVSASNLCNVSVAYISCVVYAGCCHGSASTKST
jgi:hypothetical protein